MSTYLGSKLCLIISNHNKVYIVPCVFPRGDFVKFVDR